MRISLLLIAVIFCSIPVHSQIQKELHDLEDLRFTQLINYEHPSLKFSAFRGKLVILDFWNHYCSACLNAFPRLDSLQKVFAKDVQIILVNSESKEKTLEFMKKHRFVKFPDVPMITADTVLVNMFSHEGYPFHVWIDFNGEVCHISGGYNTTEAHIRSFLAGKGLQLRKPAQQEYSDNSTFMSVYNGNVKQIEYYSSISKYNEVEHIPSAEQRWTKDKHYVGMSSGCASVKDLYIKAYRAYNQHNLSPSYAVEFELHDKWKYEFPQNADLVDEWLKNYAYNYEIIVPASRAKDRYLLMQEDLCRFFGFKAVFENRPVKGYSLIKIDSTQRHKMNKDTLVINELAGAEPGVDSLCRIINLPMPQFFSSMKQWITPHFPFIDETENRDNIDIVIDFTKLYPLNVARLRMNLQQYGLDLKEKIFTKEILVISRNTR
jgi:thiol-disulfide isomerase/thioredoxin